MMLDFSNILNLLTMVSVGVTALFLVNTVREAKAEKRKTLSTEADPDNALTDYDRILNITRELEKERERNSGEHFEDESVYLNRARHIRENSPFFSWINH